MKKFLCPERGRERLVSVISGPVLFTFLVFLWTGVLGGIVPWWYSDVLNNLYYFLVTPLAGCAVAACLLRRTEKKLFSAEMLLLFVLLLWIVVPFAVRFGAGFSNITAWFNAAAAFFGIYGLMASMEKEEKEKALRLMAGLFILLSVFWGGRLLHSFAGQRVYEDSVNKVAFGIMDGTLCAGTDRNITAMVMLCAFFFDLYGVKVFRVLALRVLSGAAALLIYWGLVMTQSRTSLYAVILTLSAGVFAEVFLLLKGRPAGFRVLLALIVTAIFAAAVYYAGNAVKKICLQWYFGSGGEKLVRETADSLANDASVNDRMMLWQNLAALWKKDWKNLLIGFGPGRVGSLIVSGTYEEAKGAAAVHNGYLQFIADYGLVGAALFFSFLFLAIRRALHCFFEPDSGRRILCLAAAAILLAGMMESTPIIPLGLMNIILMFILGALADRSRTCEQK